jgi:uncharacterized membrane protein
MLLSEVPGSGAVLSSGAERRPEEEGERRRIAMPNDFGPGFGPGVERGFDGGFHWFGIVPVVMFVVLIGVIVWAVVKLTREGRGPALAGAGAAGAAAAMPVAAAPIVAAHAPRHGDPALEELRLRYARGEMTREDYAERLADLSAPSARGPATSDPSAPATPGGT